MTAKTKAPTLPKSSVRAPGPVPMATLLDLAAKAIPEPDWLGRAVLEAMRPDPAETALDLVDRWIREDRIPACQKEGYYEEVGHYRRLQAAMARARKHGLVDDHADPDAPQQASDRQAPRDVVEAAEQYLAAAGEPESAVVAAVLIKYGGTTWSVLWEAHAALRHAVDGDPDAAELMWMVTKELAEKHGKVYAGAGDSFTDRRWRGSSQEEGA